jgi:hypothetical protein
LRQRSYNCGSALDSRWPYLRDIARPFAFTFSQARPLRPSEAADIHGSASTNLGFRRTYPPAAALPKSHTVPIGRRRAAGKLSSPRRSRLKIVRFSWPATRKAECRLLSGVL